MKDASIFAASRSMSDSSTVNKFLRFIASPLFLKLSFVWFIIQALFMSLSTRLGVSPDETYHYSFIRLFEHNGWMPFIHDQTGYYALGEVKHSPFFLYHYLLSLPLHLFSNWHAVEVLRLINIALAVWSLTLIVRLARRLRVLPLVTNLSIFMLVNTLMFVFLSGSINYDNLLIPVSLLSFIYLFDFLDRPRPKNLLKLLTACLAGSMIVINYLPILLVIVVVVAYKIISDKGIRKRLFPGSLSGLRNTNIPLLIIAIILSLLFLQRYGLNVVRYHSLSPSCQRFNTAAQCAQDGTLNRLNTVPKRPNHPRPTPFEYFTSWGWSMRSSTFGILGHESIDDNIVIRIWSELLLIGGFLAAIRYYRPSRNWNLIIILGAFYTAVLFARIYHGYYQTGYNFGIQGRYLFIFLPFTYFLFNRYILEALRKRSLQVSFIAISLLVFFISSLPTYALKTDPTWYKNARATRINNDIRHLELKLGSN